MRSHPIVQRPDAPGTTHWWAAAVALSIVTAAIGAGAPDPSQAPAVLTTLRQVGLVAVCILAWAAPTLSGVRHRVAARAAATGVALQLAADVWEHQVAMGLGVHPDSVQTGRVTLDGLSGVCLAFLVVSLARRSRRHGGRDWQSWWDAALLGAAAAVVAWEPLMVGVAAGRQAFGPAVATAFAVLAATALLARLMLAAAWRLVAVRLVAITVVLTAPVVLQSMGGGAVFDRALGLDVPQLLTVLACGTVAGAVLHPSFGRLVDDGPPPRAAPHWLTRAAVVSAAVVGPPVAVTVRALTGVGASPTGGAVAPLLPSALASVAIALGVALRLVHLLRDRDRTARLLRRWRARDDLTGLPNRTAVLDHLGRKVDRLRASPAQAGFGVLLLDLDRFRAINDAYGHVAGDAVLIDVARRLVDTARSDDVVGRMAGDEFALVCDQPSDDATLRLLAERLRRAVEAPMPAEFGVVTPRVSIGIAAVDHATAAGDDAVHRILRRADAQLRAARAARRTPTTPARSPARDASALRPRGGVDTGDSRT